MKGKITNSLKPQLTKRSSVVGYRVINFLISEVKQNEESMGNEQSQNERGGGIKLMRSHTQKAGYFKCVHIRTRWDVGRIEKSVIRSASTKWMTPIKCHGMFFVLWSGQAPLSVLTSRENVFVSLYHNTSYTIVLSYAIIRIYAIIPIYLQVSKTDGLTELN